jgi:hypothetical protein
MAGAFVSGMTSHKLRLGSVGYACEAMGMTIRFNDGEYRVTFTKEELIRHGVSYHRDDIEAVAYYTNDLEDALLTAIYMHRAL